MRIEAAVSRPGAAAPAIERVDLEPPRADELRVRVVATGICHTDLHAHEGRLSPLPIVLGHEGAGIVEAIGTGVSGFAIGDSVVLSGGSCGACPNCDRALPSYCDQAMPRNFGGARIDGSTALSRDGEAIHSHFFGQSAFATHAIVPERTAVKVDADLPLDLLGPLGCGVITGAGTVFRSFAMKPGQHLAVFGTGGVGLSAIMAARLAGAERIVAVDLNPERLALASELGATDTIVAGDGDAVDRIRAMTGGRGVDFSFNTTVAPQAFGDAVACLAQLGVAGFVSAPRGDWAPDMFRLLSGGRSIRGILGGDAAPRQFIPMLIRYWRDGRFPFDRLIRHYRFDEIAAAFADVAQGRTIKPVLRIAD